MSHGNESTNPSPVFCDKSVETTDQLALPCVNRNVTRLDKNTMQNIYSDGQCAHVPGETTFSVLMCLGPAYVMCTIVVLFFQQGGGMC